MMLVQLPDAVAVPALPSFPSWPSFLSSSFSILSSSSGSGGLLPKPSLCVWLVLLVASLVILSTIRAALLYIRPPPSTSAGGKLGFSIVRIASGTKVSSVPTATTVPSVASPSVSTPEPKPASAVSSMPSAPAGQDQSRNQTSPTKEKKTTSWFFGFVKWDTLPALPSFPTLRQKNQNTLSISQTERGGWVTSPPPHQQLHMRQSGRGFNHPPSYSYTPPGPPVSMAKMIMSRHTFRRPSSRPPPVRSASVVQYQRKFVAGGESVV